MSFGFGGSSAASSSAAFGSTGFSFGTASTGLSFGAASSASLFGASSTPATSAPAFSFGTPASTPAASSSGFSFGGASSTATASTSAPSFGVAASPAVPSFGFGAPASSSSPAPSAPAPAASTLAFSFGGASSAAAPAPAPVFAGVAASSAAASTAGFSFASSAAATSGPAAAPASSAPAASTAAAGFSFAPVGGASSAAAGTAKVEGAAATATVPAPTTTPANLQAPSEIRGRPVDEIINEWSAELEQRSRAFVRHAEALSSWDRHVMTNRQILTELEGELEKVVTGQDALFRRLQMLEAHQKGIHDTLTNMESEAERLYRDERALADDEAVERDRLYERAEKVGNSLSKLGSQLAEAIDEVNSATAVRVGAASTPLGKLVRILNNQLQAVTQIEAKTEELSAKLSDIQGQQSDGFA